MTRALDRSAARPVSPLQLGRPEPVALQDVSIEDGFWADLQARNRERTIPHIQSWIEQVGTLENFLPPAERSVPERRGVSFTDSDVYKLLEAVAWETARAGEPPADAERLTATVARALEDDGYINTYWGAHGRDERYVDLQMGHELYCHGHLIQASVAAARAEGPEELVELGRRAGDHVCREFGPDGPHQGVCGHPEIEMALVELYRSTGEARYLETARAMIDRRGHGTLGDGQFGPAYYQDDVPVRDAKTMRGHAVRALYLLSGAVDVAVETDDSELLAAVEEQYRASLARRTYLTGGMGSRHEDESFGDDFELPPDRAYAETCAGVASAMLAWRLFLATGDVSYGDHIERTLYNVVSASPALTGTSFFYTNPLRRATPTVPSPSDRGSRAATAMRAPWFVVPCCPPNLARLLASLGGYLATTDADGVQLHQYASGTVHAGEVTLVVDTDYPRDGRIAVRVQDGPATPWTLALRVPAWAQGATLTVDGGTRRVAPGSAQVRRAWAPGDTVHLDLPIAPRWSAPDPRIDAVRGCVACERGPLVYCAESVTGTDSLDLDAFVVEPDTARDAAIEDLDGMPGVAVTVREVLADAAADWPYGAPAAEAGARRSVTLIPYHAWANRGPSTMRVWLPL
jgi:uncharacterized protein